MIHTSLKIVPANQTEAIFPGTLPAKTVQGTLEGVAILEGGMESGKTSVMLKVDLPDGSVAIVQTSAAMLLTLAAGCRGAMERFGDPWDGA